MPRSSRMSKNQKQFLVNYLENHKFLLNQTKYKPSELEKYSQGWKKLADELNKCEEGSQKTTAQWKDALNEFKVNTRRKARLLHQEAVGTGGGPKTKKPLTELEERLLGMLSNVVILGVPDIPEGGFDNNVFENDAEVMIEEYIFDPGMALESTENNIANNIILPSASNISNSTPILPVKKNFTKKTCTAVTKLDDIAVQHTKCLTVLANSNNNLARATLRLSRALRKNVNPLSQLRF